MNDYQAPVSYTTYLNRGGNSSVIGYKIGDEIGDDFIRVTFKGGARYLYTYASCGSGARRKHEAAGAGGTGARRVH
jgi:hypothetical protein